MEQATCAMMNKARWGWYRYPPKMGPIPPELIHVFGHVSVCT